MRNKKQRTCNFCFDFICLFLVFKKLREFRSNQRTRRTRRRRVRQPRQPPVTQLWIEFFFVLRGNFCELWLWIFAVSLRIWLLPKEATKLYPLCLWLSWRAKFLVTVFSSMGSSNITMSFKTRTTHLPKIGTELNESSSLRTAWDSIEIAWVCIEMEKIGQRSSRNKTKIESLHK